MREIEFKRFLDKKETIFPLHQSERFKYIALSSILLVKSEKKKLSKTVVFLLITSAKLCVYMLVDYCFFWILTRIRYSYHAIIILLS